MSSAPAESYFSRARAMSAEGHFEYAIDLFLDGLKEDPGNIEAHAALRETALRRSAAGGKDLVMLQKVKLRKPGADAVEDLLNIEKLLAYDPNNLEWLAAAIRHADAAGLMATKHWFFEVYSNTANAR
jgi:hypothetical protein